MPWSSLRLVLATLFHLFPILLFGFGYPYAGLAGVLLVAMPYIKDKKLAAQMSELEAWRDKSGRTPLSVNEQASPCGRPDVVQRELDSLRKARRRWRALTFLSPLPQPAEPAVPSESA